MTRHPIDQAEGIYMRSLFWTLVFLLDREEGRSSLLPVAAAAIAIGGLALIALRAGLP